MIQTESTSTIAADQDLRMTAITSLAILKADINSNARDYLDYLVPFVKECLNDFIESPVSDSRVADSIHRRFGLHIPNKTIQHVLRRLVKQKTLLDRDGAYWINGELTVGDLEPARKSMHQKCVALVNAYITYTEENHNASCTEEQALNALLSFLRRFGVECLRAFVFESALPDIDDNSASTRYLVGSFVRYIRTHNPSQFEALIALVQGQMYSNAILCPDLESLEKKFQSTNFYFDTPLIFDLLQLQGDEQFKTTSQLLSMLHELKAECLIFSHTLAECTRVLESLITNYNKPSARGRMSANLSRSGYPKSDLIVLKGDLEKRIRDLGIKIKNTPPYKLDFQIDENTFQGILEEELSYFSENALNDDINSVRSIYALRRGLEPVRLEDAGAIFVTPNSAFAKAAYNFGRTHNSSREVSSVITNYSLSNVAWLKMPMKRPDVPELEVMSICYAAMQPTARHLRKYIEEIDRISDSGRLSPDDHILLRSQQAEDELMTLTMGDDRNFNSKTVEVLVETIKTKMVKEKDNQITEISGRLTETNRKLESTEKVLDKIANITAKTAIALVFAVLVSIIIYGGLAGASLIGWGTAGTVEYNIIRSTVIIFVAISIYALFFGHTIRGVYSSCTKRLAEWLRKKFVPSNK